MKEVAQSRATGPKSWPAAQTGGGNGDAFLVRSPTGVRRDPGTIPQKEKTQGQEYCLCPQGTYGLVPPTLLARRPRRCWQVASASYGRVRTRTAISVLEKYGA